MKNNENQKSSLTELLFIFRRNILKNIKKEGLKNDLTFSQLEVMYLVGSHNKQTMTDISNHLEIKPPSTTEIIFELEKKGLVKRKSSKEDRRIVFIELTDKSKKLYISMLKQKDLIFKKMISKLNDKDKKTLKRIIGILINE